MARSTTTPYKLPEPITMDPADLDEYGLPTFEKLRDLLSIHGTRIRRYEYLENLYLGFHDIFRKPERENWKPDWRLSCGFPYYIVSTFVGYGYSIPVKISHKSEQITEEIKKFLDANEFEDLFAQIVTDTAIYGHTWTYLYQDEDAQTNLTEFTPKEFFCVYDDTLKKRALFSVRYGTHTTGRHKGEIYGEVISPTAVRKFDNGDWTGLELNQWGKIPAVEWILNDFRMGLFEPIASLVELYDHTLSEKGNDVDHFAAEILKIIGPEVDLSEEDIRSKALINIYGDSEEIKGAQVDYLQKPEGADEIQEHLLTRLEKHIYQFCQVANISDEDFGSATSGVALSYKLWSTSNVVQKFNAKITKSLKKIFKLWGLWGTNTADPAAYKDLVFTFSKNLPRNLKEETETARLAEGIVSKRRQLSLLSYVEDPDEEIEQIEKEEKDLIDSYGIKTKQDTDEDGDA